MPCRDRYGIRDQRRALPTPRVDSPHQSDDLASIVGASDSTIADLHYTLQIVFGWSDLHLNLFHIHGQDYGVYDDGGMGFSTDPSKVLLRDFKFRVNERFRYEYDFGAFWEHQVRLEARLPVGDKRIYPRCMGGERRPPPEDCGAPV